MFTYHFLAVQRFYKHKHDSRSEITRPFRMSTRSKLHEQCTFKLNATKSHETKPGTRLSLSTVEGELKFAKYERSKGRSLKKQTSISDKTTQIKRSMTLATTNSTVIYIDLKLSRLQFTTVVMVSYPWLREYDKPLQDHYNICIMSTQDTCHGHSRCNFKQTHRKVALFTQQKSRADIFYKFCIHSFYFCLTVFLHSKYYSSLLNHK
jgi:hypothetical protein